MRQHRSSTKSNDAHWSQRQKRAALAKDLEPPLHTIGGNNCWCGQPQNHDWPGRAEGQPHPRESGARR